MTGNFASASIFLIQTFFGIYLILVMLRFLTQLSRADYYNPICQTIVKLTDPTIKPLRTVLPAVRGVDFATLAVALLVHLVAVILIMTMVEGYFFAPVYIAWALLGIVSTILDIYFFALLISVVISWLAPHSNHPAIVLINELINPICEPARKIIPPLGGLDFSIIIVFMAITLIDQYLLIKPLAVSLGIPRGLILGL